MQKEPLEIYPLHVSNSPTYKIIFVTHFKRQLKRLNKKDRLLKENLVKALEEFHPEHSGSVAIGRGVFKIRIQRSSSGKSGGYRVYLLLVYMKNFLIPVCIYPKNEKEVLTEDEVSDHIEEVKSELEFLY